MDVKVSVSVPFAVVLAFVLLLAGCNDDGKGSTSGGGGGAPPAPANPYAGTYTGTASMRASGLGREVSTTEPITITIGTDGTVSVDGQAVGTMNGNTFTVVYTVDATLDGYECNGTVVAAGSVSGDTVSGAFGATTLNCNGLPLEFSGTFTATKTG